jgi:hypothetical protein
MLMDPIRPFAADTALDHALLVAGAAVSQASSPTAVLAQQIGRQRRPRFDNSLAALVEVFATQDVEAADALDGSFHPHVARQPYKQSR